MSEMWKNWEGQVVDHKYQLRQFLGSTDHSVVFLAEFHGPEVRQCAVKFISAEFAGKEEQLAAWSSASQLSHPHLLQIYGAGASKMEDVEVLYVAMEYAEENLSQVLPHRALMAEETSEILNAVVDVLVYLHEKNLVHGHVKPSNVLALGDRLKLSSDTIDTAGEVRTMRRERSAYDAPEVPEEPFTQAADVWSLGVTLVEAFTQQQAVLPFNENADPIIPPTVHEPFLEIARNALRRKPRLRWTSARIAEALNPAVAAAKSVAVAAGAGISTPQASATPALAPSPVPPAPPSPVITHAVDVPPSQEPAIPLAKMAAAQPESAALPTETLPKLATPARQTVTLPNYVIPLFAGALLVIALAVLPFALRHRGNSEASSVKAPPATSNSAVSTSRTNSTPAPQPSSGNLSSSTEATPSVPTQPTAVAPSKPSSVSTSTPLPESGPARNATAATDRGDVLDQVKPQAAAKAMATISGTVRVGVKVHVDAAGNVAEAVLQSAGPSRYFADASLKAARQWVFTPPEVGGHSVASDWLIQFHYTRGGVEMSSQQLAP
ncbi:MAG TPA: TonB family protein [Verrucomicrobiae bacterium]|nr:TonB family protein [Verrucomicrobiae bacterium]